MKVIFLILIFYSILLISSFYISEEEKKQWQEATGIKRQLLSVGITMGAIFEYLLKYKDFQGSGCYIGASIIPECPKGTEEHILYFPYLNRACYKKCKSNEIRRGNQCYKCKDGVEIYLKEYAYDEVFNMKLVCGPNEEKPEAYNIKVNPDHCMKNTIKNQDGCDIDCSILGLKNFGSFLNGYCAKDKEEYLQLLSAKGKIDFNIFLFDLKFLISKYVSSIFDSESIGFKESVNNYFILSHQKIKNINFQKLLSELRVNLYLRKQFLKNIGKERFIEYIQDIIVGVFDKGAADEIIQNSKYFIGLMWMRMIETNKIEKLKLTVELFLKLFIQALDQFVKFVDIIHLKDYMDLLRNCQNSEKINYDECFESILTNLENFDPTMIINFIRTFTSLIIPVCDIPVKTENSDMMLFWGGEQYPLFKDIEETF